MKKGTYIYCESRDELKQTLKELGDAGYGAVVWSYDTNTIIITSVPEMEEL